MKRFANVNKKVKVFNSLLFPHIPRPLFSKRIHFISASAQSPLAAENYCTRFVNTMANASEGRYLELRFLDSRSDLPPNRPIGYPRLFQLRQSLDQVDLNKLRLVDGIVTILHNYNPVFLTKFLDLNEPYVSFEYRPRDVLGAIWFLVRYKRRVHVGTTFEYLYYSSHLTYLYSAVTTVKSKKKVFLSQ